MSDFPFPDSERTRCDVYTRVMGYYRPTWAFNLGKAQEASDRKLFTEARVAEHPARTDEPAIK